MTNTTADERLQTKERPARERQGEPRRGPEHDRMGLFAGRWQSEGRGHRPEGRMIADETWEWLAGGFFLICRFDSRVGEAEHKGQGALSYDAARKTHVLRLIDNLGYDRLYDASINGNVWTFRGTRERATYEFSDDCRSIDIRWEFSNDGRDWQPLCELTATRTGGLGPTKH